VDRRRRVLGNDHGGGAGGRGAAQAGAEVVRILHTVQHQQQRAPAGGLDQAGQLVLAPGARRRVARGHALVADVAADAVQRLRRDAAHLDAAAAGLLLDLDQARVAGTGLDQHLTHVPGVVLDRRGHGVDAHDPLVLLAHATKASGGTGRTLYAYAAAGPPAAA